MNKVNLSDDFLLSEFLVSKEAPDIAAKMVPNIQQLISLTRLSNLAIQVLRSKFGVIRINSGLRNDLLNSFLSAKGYPVSKTSQHNFGEAAELEADSDILKAMFNYIYQTNLKHVICEAILYIDKNGDAETLHVSIKPLNRNAKIKPERMIHYKKEFVPIDEGAAVDDAYLKNFIKGMA